MEKIGQSKIQAVLNRDLNVFSNILINIPQMVINMIIIIGCCLYLDYFSYYFFFLITTLLTISIISFWLYDKFFIKCKFIEVRDRADDLYQSYQSMLNGFKELKLNHEKHEIFRKNHLFKSAILMRDTTNTALTRYTVIQNTWDNLFYLVIGIIVFVGLPHQTHTQIMQAIVVLLFMMAPLKGVILIIPQLRQSIISLKKIEELKIEKEKVNNNNYNQKLIIKKITLDKVSYQHKQYITPEIDATLKPGEITFLIGKNGSGKSTLAKLISGLYTPSRGTITVNDEPLTTNNICSYRNRISAIFSDFYLFDEMKLDYSTIYAQEFIEKLGLKNKLLIDNNRISSKQLSSGQKKRLALLNMYLEGRQVLIFDEWASDQDPEYKKIFYEVLLPQFKKQNKIIVVISHDQQYFHVADQKIII